MNPSSLPQATAKSSWSLEQWLAYLLAIHPKEIDMTLSRVQHVFEKLALDFSHTTIVTVGGTNGKGSTCRCMELCLLAQGKNVGVYSSPHLVDYRERVRINDELLNEDSYCQAFQVIERMRGDVSLTYFEFGTLAALWMLNQAKTDVILLEVGLGGRLDATNIIDSQLAVITSIGLDHQEFLGDTLESVASEKSGIFRNNTPIVLGERHPPSVMLDAANEQAGDKVIRKGKGFDFSLSASSTTQWSWHRDGRSLSELPKPAIAIDNAATALAALDMLGLLEPLCSPLDKLREVLKNVSLPGRFQTLRQAPLWIADVGHNPHASSMVAQQLKRELNGRLFIVVGMMHDKSIAETLEQFYPLDPTWYPVALNNERAASPSALGQVLKSQKVAMECHSVEQAIDTILPKLKPDDTVLVFGSFVTVADVLTLRHKLDL